LRKFLDGVNTASFSLLLLVSYQLGKDSLISIPSLLIGFSSFFIMLKFKNLNSVWPILAGEIFDEEKRYSVSLDIPGIKKEDINLEVNENQLFVTGERKRGEQQVVRSEKVYGKFARVFTLPKDVNPDAIVASFENGMLDISLPKRRKSPYSKDKYQLKPIPPKE